MSNKEVSPPASGNMVEYCVTDQHGRHVMTAPMSTLIRLLELDVLAIRRIEHETKELSGSCELHDNRGYRWKYWAGVLHVRRLPIEIAQQLGRATVSTLIAILIIGSILAFAFGQLWQDMQAQRCLQQALEKHDPMAVCWKGDR